MPGESKTVALWTDCGTHYRGSFVFTNNGNVTIMTEEGVSLYTVPVTVQCGEEVPPHRHRVHQLRTMVRLLVTVISQYWTMNATLSWIITKATTGSGGVTLELAKRYKTRFPTSAEIRELLDFDYTENWTRGYFTPAGYVHFCVGQGWRKRLWAYRIDPNSWFTDYELCFLRN